VIVSMEELATMVRSYSPYWATKAIPSARYK
jgi:hypothetical protein